MKLQIKGNGTPDGTQLLLDGVDVADVTFKAEITIEPDGARALLHLYELDLDLCTDKVRVYRACANCRAELTAPPASSDEAP